jgi:hypothetical protein
MFAHFPALNRQASTIAICPEQIEPAVDAVQRTNAHVVEFARSQLASEARHDAPSSNHRTMKAGAHD